MKKIKILVTGGGTSGHIYPILEVVDMLSKRHKIEALYVGGRGNIEEQIVPSIMSFKAIPVGKLRRHFTLLNIRDGKRVLHGILAAKKIVNSFKPDIIFAKGGYVSLPIIATAYLTNIPVVMHESDSVLGLANRIGARIAKKVCVGFPLNFYPKLFTHKMVFTGTPIRKSFFTKSNLKNRQVFGIRRDLPLVVITGGSQGALALNLVVKAALPVLLRRMQIIHLVGPNFEQDWIDYKNKLDKNLRNNYHSYGYLKDGMPELIKLANLVVSRAGSTVSEIAAAGRPMILIPLPTAAGDHQTKNAEIYTKEGAAVAIKQSLLTQERLIRTINTLINDEYRLQTMSKQARKLSRPDATDAIVRVIEEEIIKK